MPENKIVTPPGSHSPKLLYREKKLQLYAQMPHYKEKINEENVNEAIYWIEALHNTIYHKN